MAQIVTISGRWEICAKLIHGRKLGVLFYVAGFSFRMREKMHFKLLSSLGVVVFLSACWDNPSVDEVFGSYSIKVKNVKYELVILRDGTYSQKKIENGVVTQEFDKSWTNISDITTHTRIVLQGFIFPGRKNSSEWPAALERKLGRLTLCYFDEAGIKKCYKKDK